MTGKADWGVTSGVGMTALAVAAARAVESRRSFPLVRDPYAESFVLAASTPLPTTPEALASDPSSVLSQVHDYVAVRSKFFDEYFTSAVPGVADVRQAVILAAGLDTRAFRLEWPDGVTVYEVDAPLVLSFKDKVLTDSGAQAASQRRAVAADLREDWAVALSDAGFDPARPTAWLAEGLLPYLPDQAKASLLAAVQRLSAPGSLFAIEHFTSIQPDEASNAAFLEAAKSTDFRIDMDTLLSFEYDYDPVTWLRGSGWSVDVSPVTAMAERYGRPLPPSLPEALLSSVLLTALKPSPA